MRWHSIGKRCVDISHVSLSPPIPQSALFLVRFTSLGRVQVENLHLRLLRHTSPGSKVNYHRQRRWLGITHLEGAISYGSNRDV
jgi:hypothetical protein